MHHSSVPTQPLERKSSNCDDAWSAEPHGDSLTVRARNNLANSAMLIFIAEDYAALSREAARIIANSIRKKPDLRLGLATGDTQVGMYRELIRTHREELLDFSQVVTFNLDEYVGLPAGHPQSFRFV